ncbi:phosphoserine phosphatase SerB [Gluconacetobacter entanii]|uniref:phosphoserine phosphatase SerB n=1 Tax=Gluconacetobacter entanii TaxID=108528 RepID=UPI001C9351E9|nr:phosphoserine phosphatase SerB [Gluconacetobacter entanii]MBY4640601.1 phosphoserine phosphatase SerB [Gluconacetobacter entanii]MCW4579081.1 phosphoserine phosphatase SerB [Gluconacetobacter entanii]MCW4582481.1 phosphoserine phosphatase SerB [Gluconacetobacter entanii]MCW4585865.1 phosphoserine phosphatase SerB [Gluconacetobacter entanii]
MADSSPSPTHFLVLVANRDATSLGTADIAHARDMTGGAAPVTLSEGEAVEIPCPAPGTGDMPHIAPLREEFSRRHLDAIVVSAHGRRKRLLVADMDSTIVDCETLDDLARHAGIGERIAEITRRSMNGEMDFEAALRERVGLLRGMPATLLEAAWRDVRLNPGALELVRTMRKHGAHTALVSGGFTFFTSRVAEKCGFDEQHANTLLIEEGHLTGKVGQPILGPDAKLAHLRRLVQGGGLHMGQAMAVGDGANDLAMLREAGLGIAFHAKPAVRNAIAAQVNHTTLRTPLFAQGYAAADFVA